MPARMSVLCSSAFGGRRPAHAHFLLQLYRPCGLDPSIARDIDGPMRRTLGNLELRMPDSHDIRAWRQLGQHCLAVASGLGKKRRFGYVDVADHPVVDVATQNHYARLVENDR